MKQPETLKESYKALKSGRSSTVGKRVSRGVFGFSVLQEVIPREEESNKRKATIQWDIKFGEMGLLN